MTRKAHSKILTSHLYLLLCRSHILTKDRRISDRDSILVGMRGLRNTGSSSGNCQGETTRTLSIYLGTMSYWRAYYYTMYGGVSDNRSKYCSCSLTPLHTTPVFLDIQEGMGGGRSGTGSWVKTGLRGYKNIGILSEPKISAVETAQYSKEAERSTEC